MTAHALRSSTMLLPLVLLCALLAACSDQGRAQVERGRGDGGWSTLVYDDIQVEIPTGWTRFDSSGCEVRYEEAWSPPGATCRFSGVTFYASATFDPALGPGVHAATSSSEPAWSGYTYAGEYAVYAAVDDRATVERVLDSARRRAS